MVPVPRFESLFVLRMTLVRLTTTLAKVALDMGSEEYGGSGNTGAK